LDSVAALSQIPGYGIEDGTVVYLKGYSQEADGGGGFFRFSRNSTETVDNGMVIAAVGAGRWLRENQGDRISPLAFGAKGDGVNDDTAACQAALDTLGYLYVPSGKTFRIVPSSGQTAQELAVVSDEFIIPGATYKVTGDSVTYAGTSYDVGDTFTANDYHRTWTGSGHLRLVADVALSLDADNARIIGEGFDTNGGLYVDGPGVGVFLGNLTGVPLRYRLSVSGVTISGTGSGVQVGFIAGYGAFHSRFSYEAKRLSVGFIAKDCWNANFDGPQDRGTGAAWFGLVLLNANQQNVTGHFTHNFAKRLYVEFSSAHGLAGGESVEVRGDSGDTAISYTGTVSTVISSTEIVLSGISRNESTGLSALEASIAAATAVGIDQCAIRGGVGLFFTSAEGLWINAGKYQNGSECGIKGVLAGDSGNIGPLEISAHLEGPANGILINRGPRATSGRLYNVSINAVGINGRPGSGSDIGKQSLMNVDYISNLSLSGFCNRRGRDQHGVIIGQNCERVTGLHKIDFDTDNGSRSVSGPEYSSDWSILSFGDGSKPLLEHERAFPLWIEKPALADSVTPVAGFSIPINSELLIEVRAVSRLGGSYSDGFHWGRYRVYRGTGSITVVTLEANNGGRTASRIPSMQANNTDHRLELCMRGNGSNTAIVNAVVRILAASGDSAPLNTAFQYL
jgi:hypothetical protein